LSDAPGEAWHGHRDHVDSVNSKPCASFVAYKLCWAVHTGGPAKGVCVLQAYWTAEPVVLVRHATLLWSSEVWLVSCRWAVQRMSSCSVHVTYRAPRVWST